MIFRRVKAHIEKENWFAVFIDFLIVVVGILIAFQITSWSEASQANKKESLILDQLESEFTEALEFTRNAKIKNDAAVKANYEVLRVIRDKKEPADKAEFLKTLQQSGTFSRAALEPTALNELLSTGGLSLLSSPTLRKALVQYHELMLAHQTMSDIVLNRVSTPHDGFHEVIYINPDFESDGVFLDRYDWDSIGKLREQNQVLIYGKGGLSNQMKEIIAQGETVLTEIKAAQQ